MMEKIKAESMWGKAPSHAVAGEQQCSGVSCAGNCLKERNRINRLILGSPKTEVVLGRGPRELE